MLASTLRAIPTRQNLKVQAMDNVTVSFQYDTAHFVLHYPQALVELPLENLCRLFKFMTSDHAKANADAIRITHEALKTYVAETKAAWSEASIAFWQFHTATGVRAAEAAHIRAKTLLACFEKIKAE